MRRANRTARYLRCAATLYVVRQRSVARRESAAMPGGVGDGSRRAARPAGPARRHTRRHGQGSAVAIGPSAPRRGVGSLWPEACSRCNALVSRPCACCAVRCNQPHGGPSALPAVRFVTGRYRHGTDRPVPTFARQVRKKLRKMNAHRSDKSYEQKVAVLYSVRSIAYSVPGRRPPPSCAASASARARCDGRAEGRTGCEGCGGSAPTATAPSSCLSSQAELPVRTLLPMEQTVAAPTHTYSPIRCALRVTLCFGYPRAHVNPIPVRRRSTAPAVRCLGAMRRGAGARAHTMALNPRPHLRRDCGGPFARGVRSRRIPQSTRS